VSGAPWWGWLILLCVALLVVGWVTVALIAGRTARHMTASFEERTPPPLPPPFGRRL
jgi:Sec-independent protein translocase protein TatA